MLLSVGVLFLLALLAAGAQLIAHSGVQPRPLVALHLFLGLVPDALALALPVGVLAGVTVVGRLWREDGAWLALASSGRRLGWGLVPVLLTALWLGGVELALTGWLAPAGRAHVRTALDHAAGSLVLREGIPVQAGEALLYRAPGDEGGAVFLASGDLVLAASDATMEPPGVLRLGHGSARQLDGQQAGWVLRFSEARVPLGLGGRRVQSAERGSRELLALILRMEARGREASAERLALYKRAVLPLAIPLLVLLGLPLGARHRRPALSTIGVTLVWWAVMRVGDQTAALIGPLWACGAPLGLLALGTAWAWWRWRTP